MSNQIKVPAITPRDPDSHKGNFGRVLIVGGSRGMTGAAVLAGFSAVKAGAGLVTVAVPDRCLETVATGYPCYMTVPLPDDDAGRMAAKAESRLLEVSASATSVGIGPGISKSEAITKLVLKIYRVYSGPMVVDADALNALATSPKVLSDASGPRILTPHIGEFRRIAGDESLSSNDCQSCANELASRYGIIIVLKGHQTLVTDGNSEFKNNTGNPGMATGGAGDVLTGVITALLSQGYSPMEAAVLGVHVHGTAGDIARDELFGEISLDAYNIANFLPAAFRSLLRTEVNSNSSF